MAMLEYGALLQSQDEGGNWMLLYPATLGEHVMGAVEDSQKLGGLPASAYATAAHIQSAIMDSWGASY